MRFELTTFTLATCWLRVVNGYEKRELGFLEIADSPNMHGTHGTGWQDGGLVALIGDWANLSDS